MVRNIPGTIQIPAREFVYVEYSDADAFRMDCMEIGTVGPGRQPTDGGLMYDEAMLALPNSARFFALTYNRDLEGWRGRVYDWCRVKGLRWGKIEGEKLVLCTGESCPLSDCSVEFTVWDRSRKRPQRKSQQR